MASGISLANKCQLLFGFSVLMILAGALSVPFLRSGSMVEEFQVEEARRLADLWFMARQENVIDISVPMESRSETSSSTSETRLALIPLDTPDGDFQVRAADHIGTGPGANEYYEWDRTQVPVLFRYARGVGNPVQSMVLVERNTGFAQGRLIRSQVYILTAGILACLLAILVFYLILTRVIFYPVRSLRETTERVQAGDLAVRWDLRTGDEFEQLGEAFNNMLMRVEQGQDELQAINRSLDLRVDELAEVNVGLDEANRLKSEFLASISHELKTPLNSIIGFADLLGELVEKEEHPDPKRHRYLQNILQSGQSLLEMINELLDMAKMEAGRMEVTVESTSIIDLLEGLVRIMRPQASSREITMEVSVAENVSVIRTDPGKLQQILYNFLSNAVKFSPEAGTIMVHAERFTEQGGEKLVRISVRDHGPGIPEDMQDVIFDKFRQVDAGHTREHQGAGLGLAICKDLATLLHASVSFTSRPGHGATFSVDLPLAYQESPPAMPLMGSIPPVKG